MERKNKWAAIFTDLVTLDLRSLGIFRICLGVVILIDLWVRSFDLEMFYTDQGVFPVDQVDSRYLTIHALSGEADFIRLLFIVSALLAILLIAGFKTRLMVFLSWFMLISLHSRNFMVLNAGDTMLRLMMFISIFLPLGTRFSIDAKISPSERERASSYFSVWTVAYIFQLIMVYAYAGWAKNNKTWHSGLGLYYSLKIHTYAKASASWLLNFSVGLKILNFVVLLQERLGWILLIIPKMQWFFRSLTVIIFILFHLGLLMFMELGMFPLVGIIAWIPLVPGRAWDHFFPRTISQEKSTISPDIKGLFRFGYGRLQGQFVLQCMAAIFVLIVIYGNVEKSGYSYSRIPLFDYIQTKLRVEQGWGVFSGPSKEDGWFVLEAKLSDSTAVDLLRPDQLLIWEKPEVVSAQYETHRLRKYMRRLRKGYRGECANMVNYVVKEWNDSHPPARQVAEGRFYYMKERAIPGNLYEPVKKYMLYHWVSKEASQIEESDNDLEGEDDSPE